MKLKTKVNNSPLVTALKTNQVQTAITVTFERHMLECPETGREYWSARVLMVLLGYTKWEYFLKAIERAMETCQGTGHVVSDHFPDVRKMVSLGSGSKREIKDFHLSRLASYLIAQNGDTRKSVIRAAQIFFAAKTWEMQMVDASRTDLQRVSARAIVVESETVLAFAIIAVCGKVNAQGITRSMGDEALFTMRTAEIKLLLGINADDKDRPLSDVLALELLYAKCEINNLTAEGQIMGRFTTLDGLQDYHVANATRVRERLISQNLTPELMRPMLPIGSVKGKLGVNSPTAIKPVMAYKAYIGDYNISGYADVERVDGMYVGKVYGKTYIEPVDNKRLAMEVTASTAFEAETLNSGSILDTPHVVLLPVLAPLAKIEIDNDLEYLICGYLTRLLNDLDPSYIEDKIDRKVNIDDLRSDMILHGKTIPFTGYYVVERIEPSYMVVTVYS